MKLFTATLATVLLGISCGKTKSESALQTSGDGSNKKTISTLSSRVSASCSMSTKKGISLVTENAHFEVKDSQEFKLVYTFTVDQQGQKKLGTQEFTGVLDKKFKSVFKPNLVYFLLSKGEFKSNFDTKLTERHLAKTEVLLQNGRLIVSELDIVLDLKGCQVN